MLYGPCAVTVRADNNVVYHQGQRALRGLFSRRVTCGWFGYMSPCGLINCELPIMKNLAVIWTSRWNGPVAIVVVILLAVALLLPAIQQAREAARRSQSRNNLKQIALALHNYHETSNTFPPGGVFDADGKPFHGWMTSITPYLDASPWYGQVNFKIPWDHPDQIAHFQPAYYQVYLNPSISRIYGDDGLARTHYAGNNVIFYHNSSTRLSDITSGHSQTLMAGDARDHFEPFGYAYHWRDSTSGLNASPDGFGCAVREVTQMMLVDGSVRAFSHATDPQVFETFRGVNSKWEKSPPDLSAPPAPYHVSPPVVCLWADPPTCSSLLGVQDESGQFVQAWFHNTGLPQYYETTPRTCDRQAELLKPHKSLREVNLRSALTEQGIRVLTELPNLERVRLEGHSVTDRVIVILSQCKRLKHLTMSSPAFGDAGWAKLAEASHLELIRIDCHDTIGFSPESVVKFLDLKPQCKVDISRGKPISIETIRKLAKHGEPWPAYQYQK